MAKLNCSVEPHSGEARQSFLPSPPDSGAFLKFQGLKNIILIERRSFLRECLACALRSSSIEDVWAFASIAEWRQSSPDVNGSLVILSMVTLTHDEMRSELISLSAGSHSAPTIVLALDEEPNAALDALHHGVKGYISSNVSLDFALEAMQFVRAGGTCIPLGCLTGVQRPPVQSTPDALSSLFTSRELAVIQLIRRGRSNKMIAYALNMCESTVKVHVRHIMKKTGTRNRTELAMMSGELVGGIA